MSINFEGLGAASTKTKALTPARVKEGTPEETLQSLLEFIVAAYDNAWASVEKCSFDKRVTIIKEMQDFYIKSYRMIHGIPAEKTETGIPKDMQDFYAPVGDK